jgi:hypothetical protein
MGFMQGMGGFAPASGADGAQLDIGPNGLMVVVRFCGPTRREARLLRRGALDVFLHREGGTGFLVLQWSAPGCQPLVMEAPFHIGLLPPNRRHLPERNDEETFALTVVLVDERGRQHGARMVGLSTRTSEAIEAIVREQTAEAEQGWRPPRHQAEIVQFQKRYPDITTAAKSSRAVSSDHFAARRD